MAAFFLAEIEKIHDLEKYREYVDKAEPIIKSFGGKYILRSEKIIPVSGKCNAKRIILIRFENKERLMKCLRSEKYRKIKDLRELSIESKAIIIEE
jgi:uncharacterized protein (DUF1330 family)